MQISDISLAEVRSGTNWRVTNWEEVAGRDLPLEELEIEPLGEYQSRDGVVYSGLTVHLAVEGEPDGDNRPRTNCTFAPEDPAQLRPDQHVVVRPLLMIKEVADLGWDYCELTSDGWRQLGLVPDPNAPLTSEYFANTLADDAEFSIELELAGVTIGTKSREGFWRWAAYLGQ